MKRIETYKELPVMSDDRYAELCQWRENHDRRFSGVIDKYSSHPAVNHAAVWLIGKDSEMLRKILTIIFSNLPDDEKKRRLNIITPEGFCYM